MSMHWVKADGTSQTWHDTPDCDQGRSDMTPADSTEAHWRVCDFIAAVVLVATIGAFVFGVHS